MQSADKLMDFSLIHDLSQASRSQRNLAARVGVSAAMVNHWLRAAEMAGTVERRGAGLRGTSYEVTEAGRETMRRLAYELVLEDTALLEVIRNDMALKVLRLLAEHGSRVGVYGSGPLFDLAVVAMLGVMDLAGALPEERLGLPALGIDQIPSSGLNALVSTTNEVPSDLRRALAAEGIPLVFLT